MSSGGRDESDDQGVSGLRMHPDVWQILSKEDDTVNWRSANERYYIRMYQRDRLERVEEMGEAAVSAEDAAMGEMVRRVIALDRLLKPKHMSMAL